MYRVVQWATGSMGRTALRRVIDHPDLELAGVYVYDPRKVGVDAGEIARRPPTGVRATNRIEDILALRPDVVLHMSRITLPYEQQNADVARLLGCRHRRDLDCGFPPSGVPWTCLCRSAARSLQARRQHARRRRVESRVHRRARRYATDRAVRAARIGRVLRSGGCVEHARAGIRVRAHGLRRGPGAARRYEGADRRRCTETCSWRSCTAVADALGSRVASLRSGARRDARASRDPDTGWHDSAGNGRRDTMALARATRVRCRGACTRLPGPPTRRCTVPAIGKPPPGASRSAGVRM